MINFPFFEISATINADQGCQTDEEPGTLLRGNTILYTMLNTI